MSALKIKKGSSSHSAYDLRDYHEQGIERHTLAVVVDNEAGPTAGPDRGVVMVSRADVEKVVEVIRPAIQADEGDIELVEVDEATGVVTVELLGACVDCPASTQTLKAGIERIMMDRVPGVTEVRNAGDDAVIDEGTAVSL